jgi:hypothetical protein
MNWWHGEIIIIKKKKNNKIIIKSLHATWISNFRIFFVNLSPGFKYVILSRLNELLELQYMVEELQSSTFQPNFNRCKISPVALDMSKTIHESLVWHIWEDSSTNFNP